MFTDSFKKAVILMFAIICGLSVGILTYYVLGLLTEPLKGFIDDILSKGGAIEC